MTAPIFSHEKRTAFTLFELILAIALSATLMVLIGSAINLYLLQVDASRTEVEEAQLARSILSMIAADVRASTVYLTQDTSAVEQLAASAAAFDVDDLDASGTFSGSALGAAGGSSSAGGSGSSSSGTSLGGGEITTALAPGLNGTLQELILDVTRLPPLNELFPAVTEQSGGVLTSFVNAMPPSDIKTVRYFIRQGNTVDASDVATTSLAPEAQFQVGGLVRQVIDRAARDMAEQSGNSAILDSGQVLLAPEVVHVEFRYFDGTEAVEDWIMEERGTMPPAVEVRIWLIDPYQAATQRTTTYDALAGLLDGAQMYSQTIDLPLSQSKAATAATDTSSSLDETEGDDR